MAVVGLVWTCMIGLIAAQDKIPVTMVTSHPFNAESRNPYPEYYCYLNSPDADARVTANRVWNTRSGTNNNPAPPSPELVSDNSYPAGSAVYRVSLSFSSNTQSYAFGTFSCEASKEGRKETKVSNILMNSDVHSSPADGQVTQTVNSGDSGVEITMTVSDGHRVQRWHRNGTLLFKTSSGSAASSGTLLFARAVQNNSHAGVYEAVTNFDKNPRRQPRHGLKRLLVRSCAASHWGPPGCAGVCDNCYNGGVCDDETGRCICAPGFMGENCLTACGGNRFGYSCEFQCSYDEDDEDSCSGLQFCLLDPFGCRCNTGWKDLSCDNACSEGTFGASCLQDCHCEGLCDRFTGVCTGTCEVGWNGDSCQIPDVCPPGFFGAKCSEKCYCREDTSCDMTTGVCKNSECIPGYRVYTGGLNCQECRGDSIGESCIQVCPCDADACNKVTSDCSGQCKPQWVDSYWCVAGLESVNSSMVNPNTVSNVSCVTQTFGNSYTVLTVNLSREPDQVVNRGIEFLEKTRVADMEVWRFTADGVVEGEELFCLVLDQENIIVARLSTTFVVYELPVLSSPPTLVTANTTSITIRWRTWDPDRDDGDPPIVAYIPYYREAASEGWVSGAVVPPEDTPDFLAENLEPDTNYGFTVAVVREGVNGEGPRGPTVILRTFCNVSDVKSYNVTADVNPASGRVNISWLSPQARDIKCSRSVSSFSIYYKEGGTSDEPQLLITKLDASENWIIVDTKDLGEGDFSFFVSLTIDEESPLSQGSTNITIKLSSPGETAGIDNTILIIALIIAVVFIMMGLVLVLVVLRVKKRKGNAEESTNTYTSYYNNSGVTIESANAYMSASTNGDSKANHAVNREEDNKTIVDDADEDVVNKEEDDLEESEIVYGNLQTPEKVKVAELRDYINSNLKEGRLEQEFTLLKKGKQYPWTIAEKRENKTKNRFRNLYTYDHSRVVLEALPDDEHSDYYNASYIVDSNDRKVFIAAQGPNTASLNDFWRMVWSQNVSTIVMVTNLIENRKDQCLKYWSDEGVSQAFGDIVVSLVECSSFADYVIRKLHVVLDKDDRIIYQLHYVSWPDMGTPKQPTPLIAFTKQAKMTHRDKKTPMVVHCSAGIGRTGTFIALYSLLDNVTNDEYVNVFDFVKKMREDRVNMVQTGKQYVFLYMCLMEASLTSRTEMTRDDIGKIALDQQQERPKKEFQLLIQLGEDDMAYSNYLKEAVSRQTPSMSEQNYNLTANFLKSFKKEHGYITSAYPKPDTVDQFWKLVYTWKCSIVVMLDQLDADKLPYWPESDSSKHGKYSVSCKGTGTEPAFVLRQFEICHDGKEDIVSVNHLQLTSWPARDNLSGLDSIIRKVIALQKDQMLDGPVVVHCVDGERLSCIFVAVSSEIERLQYSGKVDMFKTVRQLRETNTDILASEDDYLLCYKLLIQYLEGPHIYQNM